MRFETILTLETRLVSRTRHRIQVYEPGQCDAPLASTFTLVPGTPQRVHWHTQQRRPVQLLVRWYADDATGVQVYVAGGAPESLIDANGRVQGCLLVDGYASPKTFPAAPPMHAMRAQIDAVRAAHRKYHAHADDTFCEVDVMLDGRLRPMPLMWYAASAVAMHTHDGAADLFAHWTRVARRLEPDTRHDTHQRLADVLALPSRAWTYQPDRTPDGKDADCWASVWAFPDPERAAFDCEDGSKACYELFHVLCGIPDNELAILARKYTPYLGIVQLRDKTSHTYILHCILVLLSDDEPPLTIESTEHASAVWRTKATTSSPRTRVPLAVLRQRRMYGRLFQLVSATTHYVCHDKATFGVDLETFLFSSTRTQYMEAVVVVEAKQAAAVFAPHLALAPRSLLPHAPKNDSNALTDRGMAIVCNL